MNHHFNINNEFKYPIHSVENAFSLLEIMAENGSESGIVDLCKKTSLPKGTIHRLLGTLKNLGYIVQNPLNRKYRMTLKILKLGYPVSDKIGIAYLTPYMKDLSRKFNETVNLAVLDGDEIFYIYSNGGENTLKFDLKIGSHQPAYCAALGRILIAYLPEEAIDQYLKRIELKSHTPFTITDKIQLKKELIKIRKQGYAFIKEEYMVGVFCVAVPIKNYQGDIRVGMSFSIPTARYEKHKVDQLINALLSTSKQLILPNF